MNRVVSSENRMSGGNFLRRAARASLLAGGLSLAACGAPETTRHNVSVNGWDITKDASIKKKEWVQKTDRSSVPSDQPTRNVYPHDEPTGTSTCYSRDKNYNCTFSLPDYETEYDYQVYETVTLHECRATPVFTEHPSDDITADRACWDRVQTDNGEWLEVQPEDYILRITIPDGDKTYQCNVGVNADMYHRTGQQRNGLDAVEQGHCNILSLAYPAQK